MATEKLLHTRIQLKYDTYANWTGDVGKAVVLKAGEVGICAIPAGTNAEGIQNPPHVMMKVGDGTSTFEALPWTSAKAADVHTWAKQASLPVETTGEGNAVTAIAWDAAKNGLKVTLGEKFATAAELKKVTEDIAALGDSYATDKELEDAVSALNTEIAKKADKTYVDTELGKKVDNDTFNTFKTDNTKAIEDAAAGAVADAKTETENQIKALNVTDTAVDGEYVSAVNEVEGKIVVSRKALPVDTLTEGSANGTVKFNGTDVAVHGLGDAAYTTVSALNTTAQGYATTAESNANSYTDEAIQTLTTNTLVPFDQRITANLGQIQTIQKNFGEYKGTVNQRFNSVESAVSTLDIEVSDIVDGRTAVGKATEADHAVNADKATEADHAVNADKATDTDKLGGTAAADYALKSYVDTAEEDAVKAAKTYTDEVKKAILTGDSTTELKEAYDTLVEIQEWIEGAGVNATELTEAIALETKAREDADTAIDGRLDDLEALVGENGKVSNAEVADVANSLSDSAKAEVKAVKVDNAAHADVAAKASGLDASGEAAVKAVKVDNAAHADSANAATKATQDGAGNVITETYVTKDEAETTRTQTINTVMSQVSGQISAAKGELSQQIATKDVETLASAKSYADGLIAGLDVTDAAVAGEYVSAVNETDGKISVTRAALPTYTLTTGDNNGTVKFNGTEVAVKGLGSAAYTESTAYATAAQGTKADTAVQAVGTGSENGTIAVDGTNVAVAGLKSAAYTEASAYATAAQGGKADTALQSIAAGTGLKVSTKADNSQTVEFDDAVVFVLNGGTATTYID